MQNLAIGNKRVLFVLLQRPSDTVIKYFSKHTGDYETFIAMIDEMARKLKKLGWVALCKKHPLGMITLPLKYAQYVPSDTHFIDLLELADSVALINSGVGVYAMMMGKPCYIFGDSFYQFDGLNTKISNNNGDKLIEFLISNNTTVNMDMVYKFIHYLVNTFYSFGVSSTINKQESDGSMRTITTAIDFYTISLLNLKKIQYISNKHKCSYL